MYWNLRKDWMVAVLVLAATGPLRAGPADDQYTIAARHYSKGRWQQAAEEFELFLDAYPDDDRSATVTFFLAESLVQLEQFDDARRHFAKYAELRPEGRYATQVAFRMGEAAYLAGQLESAGVELRRFHEAHPDEALNAYVLTYLGEIALDLKRAEDARTAFADCLEQFPDGPLSNECRFGLARSLESLGDADGAIRFYQFLSDQERPSELSDDALLQLAIVQYHQAKLEAAIASLNRFRDRFPGSDLSAHAAYWLGTSQLAAGRFPAAATTLSTAATQFEQHELGPAISFSAGEAYRQASDAASARNHYRRVVERWPQSRWADDSLQTLVQLAWNDGDYDQVVTLAEQFADEFPDSPLRGHVTQTLGRAQLKRGEFAAAISILESLTASSAQPAGASGPSGDAGAPPVVEKRSAVRATIGDEPPSASPPVAGDPADFYYLALAYLGAERPADALVVLDRLPPTHSGPDVKSSALTNGVRVARAAALMALERYGEATRPLQEYLVNDPSGADATRCRAQLAVALAQSDRWADVRGAIEDLKSHAPDDPLFLSTVDYVAERAYQQHQQKVARGLFQILADSKNARHYVQRGLSGLAWLEWEQEGNAARSAATFERLLQRFPESPLAVEAAMMRGQALEKMKKPEAALAMYDLVIDHYPTSKHVPAALLAASRIHDGLEQDREAEVLLRRLLDEFPDFAQRDSGIYQLAWVLVDLDRAEEADELFRQLRTTFPHSRYWADATYRLAERAARQGQFDRADQLAAELLDTELDAGMLSYALYLRGQLAASGDRWPDVAGWMKQLIERCPGSPLEIPARYWLAEASYREEKYEVAGDLFARLEQQTQGRSDAWLAMIPLRRAQVLAQAGKWPEAYEMAMRIADRFPNYEKQYEVDYLLGRYFAHRAEFDRAREAYERVTRSTTGRRTETAAMAQWMIGETYFMQKDYERAIKAYHRVESLYDFPRWQATALLQAGKCHEMIGRWDQAIALYAQIVQDYSATPVAAQASRRLRVARQRAEIARSR